MTGSGGYLERPAPSGLADVVEVILDRGIVIDAYVRVSLLGIELVTLDARVVVASVDTYLRFAEATNRLDLCPFFDLVVVMRWIARPEASRPKSRATSWKSLPHPKQGQKCAE